MPGAIVKHSGIANLSRNNDVASEAMRSFVIERSRKGMGMLDHDGNNGER